MPARTKYATRAAIQTAPAIVNTIMMALAATNVAPSGTIVPTMGEHLDEEPLAFRLCHRGRVGHADRLAL